MPEPFDTRKDALSHLEKNPLGCVTWNEKGKLMSAIYWNGKRRIQPANQKLDWSKVK